MWSCGVREEWGRELSWGVPVVWEPSVVSLHRRGQHLQGLVLMLFCRCSWLDMTWKRELFKGERKQREAVQKPGRQ